MNKLIDDDDINENINEKIYIYWFSEIVICCTTQKLKWMWKEILTRVHEVNGFFFHICKLSDAILLDNARC